MPLGERTLTLGNAGYDGHGAAGPEHPGKQTRLVIWAQSIGWVGQNDAEARACGLPRSR